MSIYVKLQDVIDMMDRHRANAIRAEEDVAVEFINNMISCCKLGSERGVRHFDNYPRVTDPTFNGIVQRPFKIHALETINKGQSRDNAYYYTDYVDALDNAMEYTKETGKDFVVLAPVTYVKYVEEEVEIVKKVKRGRAEVEVST